MAGRGWGKTRTGAEDIAYYALWHKNAKIAVVAPTFADARDTCVEGESGLLRTIPLSCIEKWNRSLGELFLSNGTKNEKPTGLHPEYYLRIKSITFDLF